MNICILSPPLAIQRGDFLGSGVPYWPLEAAILAGYLRARGDEVAVLDLFGLAPTTLTPEGDLYWQGDPLSKHLSSPALQTAELIAVFAISSMAHRAVLDMVQTLRYAYPAAKIAVLENAQAVTAYAIDRFAHDFFSSGADFLLCGDIHDAWEAVAAWLDGSSKPSNVVAAEDPQASPQRLTKPSTTAIPPPAFDLLPLQNYWDLPYAHGPKYGPYLPILTSRGCPWPCDFCVIPTTNHRRWHGRPAKEVVDEMCSLARCYGVRDFHIEDPNPTVDKHRWRRICELLIARKENLRFYMVSGTKAETIPLEDIELMAQAGCRYVSISPESGSSQLCKAMGKRFEHSRALSLVKRCHAFGIRTQACFLVGHPMEKESDHAQSTEYLGRLLDAGLDEVAIFIVAPLPGSKICDDRDIVFSDASALVSFSPRGREQFETLARRRRDLIKLFFQRKSPTELVKQGARAMLGRAQTKMENLPRRIAFVARHALACKVRRLMDG